MVEFTNREKLRQRLRSKDKEDLVELVLDLAEQGDKLREHYGLDSSNSHKGPSTDGPKTKAERRKGGKKKRSSRSPGGQPGHKGSNRKRVIAKNLDEVVEAYPDRCDECGRKGLGAGATPPYRHQVWELPRDSGVHVTEYRLHTGHCSDCRREVRAELPPGVPNRQFGPRVQGLVGYLSGSLRLSDRQVQEALEQCFALKMSLGTVANLRRDFVAILEEPAELVRDFVQGQPVVYADETTWVENYQSAYVWVASTPSATSFAIRLGRGATQAKDLLGEDFPGTAVTDRYAGYGWLDQRQFCWAHLIRDFARIAGRAGTSAVLGREMKAVSEEILRQWRRWKAGKILRKTMEATVRRLQKRLKGLVEDGFGANHSGTEGTCLHLSLNWKHLWTFLSHEEVEPTNNAAERSLRHAVIWRRVRHGTQSVEGSFFVERMLTAVTTLKQQGRNVLDFLTEATESWLQGWRAPSLLPA